MKRNKKDMFHGQLLNIINIPLFIVRHFIITQMLQYYVLRLKDKYDTQTVRYLAFVLA